MPQMPDPVSRCPIFGRLEKVTQNPKKVKLALEFLKDNSLVFVGENNQFKVLTNGKVWEDGSGNTYSEVTYLEKLWFDLWPNMEPWKSDAELPSDMDAWLTKHIKGALTLSKIWSDDNNDQKCPVLGFWECVGSGFEGASDYGKVKKKDVVLLRIKTPAPPQEIEHS